MITRRAFVRASALGALSVVAMACGGDDAGSGASGTTQRAPGRSGSTTPVSPPTAAPATTSAPPAPGGPARFVSSGPANRSRVALTFHTDGNLALAQQYLDAFAAAGVPVTCFVVGSWLEANPSWATRLTGAGHELANHTYSHLTFSQLSPQQMTDEIVRCRDLLVRLTGRPGRWFRPSGTDDGTTMPSPAVLAAAGAAGYATVVGYGDDPLDYTDPGAAAVTQRTVQAATAGSIVSLHFNHSGTLAALPGIFDGLHQKGLTPVTLSELLG